MNATISENLCDWTEKNQAKWKEENDTWLRKKAAASQTFVIVVVGKLNKMSINVRL